MKQKILKLIKILNKFTLDDILSMDEFDKQEVLVILSEFENSGVISKISKEQYIYFPDKNSKTQNISRLHNLNIETKKDIIDIKSLFSKEEEQEIYENASPNSKRRIVKYYTILKIAGQFDSRCIDAFLKQFSKEYPEYKISPSTFYRIRQKYFQYGIRGLIPKYAPGPQSAVPQEMYEEFKKLYLKPKSPSVKECVKQLNKIYGSKSIPSVQCFRRLLRKEFTPKLIAQMREISYHLPDLNFSEEEKLKINEISMELYNLDFSDIDYNNHTVLIRSSKYKFYNRIHKENLDRTLYIPDILFNQIPKQQKGQVFMKVNIPNYDTLINTHVYLSIKHNIPLNIISKNIGYTCFDDFLNRFDFALSHDFIHKINILDSI